MSIDAIGAMPFKPTVTITERVAKPSAGFSDFLVESVSQTNDHLLASDKALQQLAACDAASLHQTMLTLDEAKLSFQFLEQIRNRLMSAYQDILREQI
jgi:flagellar hook-basal body complex protein FliE